MPIDSYAPKDADASPKLLKDLVNKAKAFARLGDWGSEAVSVNTQIVEIDPLNSNAYTRLAKCFLSQEKLAAAHEMYLKVLEFDPKNTIACKNVLRLEKVAAEQRRLNDIAETSSYDEAFTVGVAASRKRDSTLAIAALKRAIELQPSSVYAVNALGSAYKACNMLDDAHQTYRHALSITPGNLVSMIGLAAVLRTEGSLKEAISLYKEVLAREPSNPYALNGIGGVYIDIGDYDNAENYFRRASAISKGADIAKKGLLELHKLYSQSRDLVSVQRVDRWLKSL